MRLSNLWNYFFSDGSGAPPPLPVTIDVLVLSGYAFQRPVTFAAEALVLPVSCVHDGFHLALVFDEDVFAF